MALVFFRSPKCGGTSVYYGLKDVFGDDCFLCQHDAKNYMRSFYAALKTHKCVASWAGYYAEAMRLHGRELLRDHYVFTLMRNPYARFISSWAFSRFKKEWIPDTMEPRDFLRVSEGDVPGVCWHHTYRPQVENLYWEKELYAHRVLANENLTAEYGKLMEEQGYPDIHLPRLNASKHKPWRKYYEEEPGLQEAVAARFKLDLSVLPYTFDQDGPTGSLPGRIR